jgi:hypothetical protein
MKARDGDRPLIYERTFLLSQEKRDQIMELWEVQKYGADSFSDSNYVCIYGCRPKSGMREGFDYWLVQPSNASATRWQN